MLWSHLKREMCWKFHMTEDSWGKMKHVEVSNQIKIITSWLLRHVGFNTPFYPSFFPHGSYVMWDFQQTMSEGGFFMGLTQSYKDRLVKWKLLLTYIVYLDTIFIRCDMNDNDVGKDLSSGDGKAETRPKHDGKWETQFSHESDTIVSSMVFPWLMFLFINNWIY